MTSTTSLASETQISAQQTSTWARSQVLLNGYVLYDKPKDERHLPEGSIRKNSDGPKTRWDVHLPA